MKRTILAAAVLTGLLANAWLQAGAQARLSGTVLDGSGHPLEGATITLTTPNLSNFKQTMKSDKNGKYGTIINDATLTYHIKVQKDGFASWETDEKIAIGDNFQLQTKLQPGTGGAPAAAAAPAKPGAGGGGGASNSDQAVMAFNNGVDALNAGDKAAAETQFLEATKKNPDLLNAWQALTQLAYDKKDWAKTLEYGRKATDLDPSLGSIYPMMAEAAKQSGDAKGAAEWSAKAAEANPEANAKGLYNAGVAAYNKGKMKDAEASLTKAVEANPDFADAHYLLGMAQVNLKKYPDAKTNLQKYLELDPKGKEAETAKAILDSLK